MWAETRFSNAPITFPKISIHSTRVGGDLCGAGHRHRKLISIHSTRVGGDDRRCANHALANDFNPLHPCGRRLNDPREEKTDVLFQSTPPVWAETKVTFRYKARILNFNPLHPCGRRHVDHGVVLTMLLFQSTPPVWAETAKETIFSSLKHLYYNIFYRKKQENSM